MTIEEHIQYWLKSADSDLETLNYLFDGKRYIHALFFGHLYLEKISKALWVSAKKELYPPKTHNILKILNQASIELNDNDKLFFVKLNQYCIEGRYPDDIEKLYQFTTMQLTKEYIIKINNISICLKENLPL